jgi:hypothetical protein
VSGFYRLKNVGPGLDGLTVEAVPVVSGLSTLYQISRIFNTNVVIGDREHNVPVDGLFVDGAKLEPTDDPRARQYADDAPYGRVKRVSHIGDIERIHLRVTEYESALGVNVMEPIDGRLRTRYSTYYVTMGVTVPDLERLVRETDPEDLVFRLTDLKQKELEAFGRG